jgi:hypothetical protein
VEHFLGLKEPDPLPLVTPNKPPRRKNSWIIPGLLSAALVITVLVWAIMWRSSPAPPPQVPKHIGVEKPAQPASLANQTYPASPQVPPEDKLAAKLASVEDSAALQIQAAAVLDNLRQAQLEKNVAKFLKSYTSTFPGLDKKQQKTLAIWKKYDYLALQYDMRHFSVLDQETLTAMVSWNLETMNRVNREKNRSTMTYRVWFSRENGEWRIKRLAPVHSP